MKSVATNRRKKSQQNVDTIVLSGIVILSYVLEYEGPLPNLQKPRLSTTCLFEFINLIGIWRLRQDSNLQPSA